MRDLTVEHQKLRAAYLLDAHAPGAPSVRKVFRDYAASLGFQKFCVAIPPGDPGIGPSSDPSLTLSRLQLVDTSAVDWKQVLEVRKDEVAHRKLARLRLFLHTNYAGRPYSYIEDDLSRRLEDYEETCRKHGLKTTLSTLSMLLNAKDFQATVGAGLVAGLFGGPLAGLAAGAVVEIGKVAIHLAERRHEMKEWQSAHELAFIFDTRRALAGREA